jgi:putative NADPH-quinone reductase
MKTLVINGSPNGGRGNSEILCRHFIKGMQTPPELRYVIGEDAAALAADMDRFDHWLFFFPLYANAMPGIVKRLFEHMQPNQEKGIGYFIQSGFEEAAQSDYLRAVLKNFNRRMRYRDLGIVIAGGMAGTRYKSKFMNRKLFARLQRAGMLYEQSGAFDSESIRLFGQPYQYTQAQLKLNRFLQKLGLSNIFWNVMLMKNNAFRKRFDKPFGI